MGQLIEDYGVIGDLHTMALVGRNGSIDWLCLPRFDSGACFARLLGGDDAGFWQIAPVGGQPCSKRHYVEDTMVLQSEWHLPQGSVRLTDFMPVRDRAADVIRIAEGLSGRVTMRMDLQLRFDYGSIVPWVQERHGMLSAVAGPDAVWLDTPVTLEGKDQVTSAQFEIGAGDRVPFVLTHHLSHQPPPEPRDADRELGRVVDFWQEWISQVTYAGPWAEAVRRSLVILKGLTYAPTGGIVAAATTSLPEQPGGPRNWDYRYCWLRDATFTLQALLGTGFVAEAAAWRDWLLRTVAGDPADLQIMYAIDGTRRLTELQLDWLDGYEDSRPVRIGNGAVGQRQLDVWGEVLHGLHRGRESRLPTVSEGWDLQRALLDYLEGNWQQPDNSLWEVRGPQRQFVHSKVLAWAGVDRGVQAVERFGLSGPVNRWKALRDEIHAEVCERGYDAERNTFTQSYESDALDSALLLLPQVGFLPWADERVIGTVEAIQRELVVNGFALRYRTQDAADGLPGHEGAFLACSFWLADALHGIGREDEARELFTRLLGLRNDLGILSEEYDPVSGRQLGNTPQAFSHVGLVNTARRLSGPSPQPQYPGAQAVQAKGDGPRHP